MANARFNEQDRHPRDIAILTNGCTMSITLAAANYVLASVASVGKIIETATNLAGRHVTAAEADRIITEAEEEAQKQFVTNPATASVFAGSMAEDIADAVNTRMARERARIKSYITDEFMPQDERDNRIRQSKREYCWAINQLRGSSGGSLPPDMQREWELNNCSQYGFTV